MAPKNVIPELDNEALMALRQARAATTQLRNMGIQTESLTPMPLNTEKKIVVKAEETKSYENYIEIQNLPSKGLFYKNKVFGQALKMEDIIQIQSIDDESIFTNLSEIFNRRIRGVDADEITIVDELYIALWLRATSFPQSNHSSSGFKCKNDKCKFNMNDPSYEFSFQQITFDANIHPDELFESYKVNGYVHEELKSSGLPVNINIRRRYHDRVLNELLISDYYKNDIVPSSTYVTLATIASVCEFDDIQYDITHDDYEIIHLRNKAKKVANLNQYESYDLIKLINKYSLTTEPVINHICPKCGEVTPIKGYPFRAETYLPADY